MLSALRSLHEFALVQLHLRAADHELLNEKRITEAEDSAIFVVLGYAIQNNGNWAARASKKLVACISGAAQTLLLLAADTRSR